MAEPLISLCILKVHFVFTKVSYPYQSAYIYNMCTSNFNIATINTSSSLHAKKAPWSWPAIAITVRIIGVD